MDKPGVSPGFRIGLQPKQKPGNVPSVPGFSPPQRPDPRKGREERGTLVVVVMTQCSEEGWATRPPRSPLCTKRKAVPPAYCTMRVKVVVWVMLPLVPVTVMA
jgi:hypothetical protein